MSNKIIFLDLDGVLNHKHYYTTQYDRIKNSNEWEIKYFDPNSVSILNRIIRETNAKIVFSSLHRFGFKNLSILNEKFKKAGIIGEVIAVTPCLPYGGPFGDQRGKEIKAWLIRNPHMSTKDGFKYAILDDDSDMLPEQITQFFCTRGYYGLTDEIADKVINYLNS